jgi:hypothetical protein
MSKMKYKPSSRVPVPIDVIKFTSCNSYRYNKKILSPKPIYNKKNDLLIMMSKLNKDTSVSIFSKPIGKPNVKLIE